MSGMDRNTGATIDGAAHIGQSIGDILSTPIGTRVMRRTYGSRIAELVDMPVNRSTLLLYAAATAGAIRKWEPRIKLTQVQIVPSDGAANPVSSLTANLTGYRTDLPSTPPVALTIPLQL